MAKNKPTARKSENVQVAKINAAQAIIVALITGILTAIPAFIVGKQHGQEATPSNPQTISGKHTSDNIIMIGSGTVYRYLDEHDILKGLINNFNVQIMEGATDTGAQLFASAYNDHTIIVLSSKRLKIEELSRPISNPTKDTPGSQQSKEQRKMRPEAVFEVYLGADQLQMFLVSGKSTSWETAFEDILKTLKPNDQLDFKDLVKVEKWLSDEYKIYVGSKGSATKDRWRENITQEGGHWPLDEKLHFWDIQILKDVVNAQEPRIYLGSEVLNRNLIANLPPNIYKEIYMLNESKPAMRGLYLYGFVDTTKENKRGGYDLPIHVKDILKHVLGSLRDSPLDLVKNDCLQKQWKYFNLDSDVGWVQVREDGEHIYKAGDCIGQPDEKPVR